MARKKTVNIEVSASFSNLAQVKKELLALNKTQISPLNKAEIQRSIKELDNLFRQFADQKLELTSTGQIKDFEKFARIAEHIQSVVARIKFPEGEIEQEIKKSEEYKKLAEEIINKQKELNSITPKLRGSQMTKAAKDVFISDYKSRNENASEEDISKALVEETVKLVQARSDAEAWLKKAQQAEKNYISEKKKTLKIDEQIVKQEQSKNIILENTKDAVKGLTAEQKKYAEELKRTEEAEKRKTLSANLKDILGYTAAIQLMRRAYRETINTIKELDNAFTEMAMVSTLTREEAWKLEGQLFNLANQTGATATEVAQLTTFYLQQGRSLKDAIELTEVAAKSAKVAGIATKEAADLLTTALNGFGMAATEAEAVADKFAKLAAVSATDFEEMATALSKVASQANMAGMSMDFTLGLLAKGIETTRESPESIGTALKTVIARMQELSDYGKTLEEGMDVNRVETMLGNLGISLRDSKGELRSLEDVITELGYSWDTLTKNQKAGIAVALAGTRQQSRLIAMMDDFERTMELTNEAQQSNGALTAQHAVYMESLQSSLTKLQNAYQEFVSSLADNQMLIGAVNILKQALNLITGITNLLGKKFMTTAVAAVFAFSKFNKITSALRDAGESAKGFGNALKIITGIDFKKTGDKLKSWRSSFLGFADSAKGWKSVKDKLKNIQKQNKLLDEQARLIKKTGEAERKNLDKNSAEYKKSQKSEAGKLSSISKKKKALREEEAAIRNNTKAQNANNEAWQQGNIVGGQSVVVNNAEKVSEDGETGSKIKNTGATKANTEAKIANAAASLVLVAGIILITKLWQNYTDAVNGANAAEALSDMAEFQDKKKSIQDLTEEFKKLNDQVLKTTDEVARMKDIIDEINQTAGDKKKLNIQYDLGGNIDMGKTQEQIDKYLEEEERKQKEKLEKAKKKSQANLGNVALWSAGGGLVGTGIGAAIGTFIGGPAGTAVGAKIGGSIGTAIGTVTGGVINWTKEKKWLKNEENKQLLKDLETYALQEEEFYKKLDDKTRQIVDSRVQTAYDLYDFSKGSVEGFEKYATQVAEDINEIETSKSLTAKLEAYSRAENRDQLKLQYALLEFLNTVNNGEELTALIDEATTAAANDVLGGLDIGSIETMQSAITNGLIEEFKKQEKSKNPEITSAQLEKALDNYKKGLDDKVAWLMGEYIKDYGDYVKNFAKFPEKYEGYTNTLTGFLQHLRDTSAEQKEGLDAVLEAVSNIKSIEQVAQSLTSTLSKISNFNTVIGEIQAGSFDTTKFIDAVGAYNLNAEQIKKLASGTLTQSDIKDIISKAQEENVNAITEAIKETSNKLQRAEDKLDGYADLTEVEREQTINNLKAEIAQYETLQSVMLTQIEIQKRSTIELANFNKQLENVEKLRNLGYSLAEIDLWAFKASSAKAQSETANELQRLVNLAGNGAIIFNEQGMPQLDLSKVKDEEIAQVQMYFEAAQTVWMEGVEGIKSALQTEYDAIQETKEKERWVLQERLDAYKEYMDEMERLEKESETNKSREDIAAQLARLGTATDAESLKRRKELTKELEELNKTQLEDERELTAKGLEEEIESLDKVINKLPEQMAEAFKQAAKDFVNGVDESFGTTYVPATQNKTDGAEVDSNNKTTEQNNTTQTIDKQLNVQTLYVTVSAENVDELVEQLMKYGINVVAK